MEPEIPEWITAEFLKESLERDDRYKDIEINDFSSSLAAPAGNNYGGLVLRVTLDCKLKGEGHKLSVIVKGPLTNGVIGEIISQIKNTEPLFYNVFLPEAVKLSGNQFAPDTFHSPIPAVVVMEDLREAGYLMADRIKQLDFEHCLLYTKAGAAFHAASIALYKQNPEMIDSVCGDVLYTDESLARNVVENMNKWALECMAKHISDKRIAAIVKDSSKHIWRMFVDLHRPTGNLNSLLQGDPWTTNMMFKYDSQGNVCDIKLLDFQNLQFGSPVLDLVFFIWFSANADVRKHRLRDLYLSYFRELNNNLKTCSCPEVDFDSFMDSVKAMSPWALATAAFSASILDSSPADFAEIVQKGMGDNAKAEKNPMERYYTEHFCQNVLPQMVDHLAAEGVFDYMEDKIKEMT